MCFFLNWSIIALQCWVSFCCTGKWISHMHTHIPSLLDLPPSPPSHPTRPSQSTQLTSLYSRFPLAIYLTHGSVFMSNLISQFIPPSPSTPPCPRVCSLHLPFYSCPANKVHLYHFSRFHIYALRYYICFSLSDLLHSVWQTLGPSNLYKWPHFIF